MNHNVIASESYYERLLQIIRQVRDPAGETYNKKKIEDNPDDFIKAFHDGYKNLHYSLISEIMMLEDVEEKFLKEKNISNQKKKIIKQTIKESFLFWRRANDCIAWMILGMDRHKIRRLCLGNTRGKLKDQNPNHVLEVLDKLNSAPSNLAIWNDATTCIDVGDILFCDKKNSKIACIELKEGIVNETIKQIIESGCERAMYYFLDTYGKKGKNQFKRTIKQMEKYGQVINLLKKNEGYCPKLGEEISFVEVKSPDLDYHLDLDELINNAREKGFSINLIDECLWLFAFDQTKYSYSHMKRKFSEKVLSQDDGNLKKWLLEFSPEQNSTNLYPIYNFSSSIQIPEALPLYLFKISDFNVLDVLVNKITVLIFLDWCEFKRLFQQKGIELVWSSKKEGRRLKTKPFTKRPIIIGERIPILKLSTIERRMMPGALFKMVNEGIRPRCIVDQRREAYEKMLKKEKMQIH